MHVDGYVPRKRQVEWGNDREKGYHNNDEGSSSMLREQRSFEVTTAINILSLTLNGKKEGTGSSLSCLEPTRTLVKNKNSHATTRILQHICTH